MSVHPTTEKFLAATRNLIEAIKKYGFAMPDGEYERLDNARSDAEVEWVKAGYPNSKSEDQDE